jgi:hypothetical protein
MGRRVADRRRRGRREELPGGAPEEKQGDMKRWETGEDASAQQKGKDVVGVGFLTGCKFTGASWNILQPTTVNIPSFLPSFLPSPDQRVELFSPVLGGSLFLARTWNRRG